MRRAPLAPQTQSTCSARSSRAAAAPPAPRCPRPPSAARPRDGTAPGCSGTYLATRRRVRWPRVPRRTSVKTADVKTNDDEQRRNKELREKAEASVGVSLPVRLPPLSAAPALRLALRSLTPKRRPPRPPRGRFAHGRRRTSPPAPAPVRWSLRPPRRGRAPLLPATRWRQAGLLPAVGHAAAERTAAPRRPQVYPPLPCACPGQPAHTTALSRQLAA